MWTSASVLADILQASWNRLDCFWPAAQLLDPKVNQTSCIVTGVECLWLLFGFSTPRSFLEPSHRRWSIVRHLSFKVDLTSQSILGVCNLPGSDPIQYITNWDTLKISTGGGHCNDASTKFFPKFSCSPLRARSLPFVPSIDEHPVRSLDFKCGYIPVKYPKASQGAAQLVGTIITDNSVNNNATVQRVISSHPLFSPSRWTSGLTCVAHLHNLHVQTNGKQKLTFEPSASTSAEAF
ncbi:hypothetical protein B0H13DRAFT_1858920 [Mycena leptocephala]|nr:hypothetical protein B0H13DRAFT_1858920 [Mycena leptocephala]